MTARFVVILPEGPYCMSEEYMRRRIDRHGRLYKVTRESGYGRILECKSVTSGVTLTLMSEDVRDLGHAEAE